VIRLDPVKGALPREWEEIERIAMRVFDQLIFRPALREAAKEFKPIHNAMKSALALAIGQGKIVYQAGSFSGQFSAAVSRELRDLGAKWDGRKKTFTIPGGSLPRDIFVATQLSQRKFFEQAARIDAHLQKSVVPGLVKLLSISSMFDRQIFRMDKDFQKNVAKISVQPKLKKEEKFSIATNYTESLERKIVGVAQKQTLELRKKIAAAVTRGDRASSLKELVMGTRGVAKNRVKFIARQEVKLFQSEFARARYAAIGIHEYLWRSVRGSPAHPVRPRHAELSHMSDKGETFRFDDPPITNEPGQPVRRNNPGCDFNCRCSAVPITSSSYKK
jgi:SPP1 gp7 family putative phage head morphogenesis protein